MAQTLQQLLRDRLEDDGDGLLHGDERWSWRDYLSEAMLRARAVAAIADQDRPFHVGVLLDNSPDLAFALAAAGLGGHVLVGLNTTRRGAGLLADVRRAECQILITDAEHRPLLDGLDLTGVRVLDTSSTEWAALLAEHRERRLTPVEAGPFDTFMLIFTSGTSGDPKAVQVSHFMVLTAGLTLAERFGLQARDVCYVSMPLFHSNAVVAGWGVALASGAAMAVARFHASGLLADVRRYRATYLNYVGKPLAYVLATAERPDDADNPLRIAFGNEASDRDIAEFSRRFGCQVRDGFGSTENAVIVTRTEDTPPGSIGQPADGVAVHDAVSMLECPRAEFDEHGTLLNAEAATGELVNTAGRGYFTGYYNDPEADDERMRGGMYWSGDLAYRDSAGFVYLAGRTADWMRVDGENLAAAPIERILLRLPAVNRVAVYAVPDASAGDQVMAALVLGAGTGLEPAALESFLAAQPDLSPKAWPRYVRIAPDLPSTATHKVLKRELVGQALQTTDVVWERAERGTSYAVR